MRYCKLIISIFIILLISTAVHAMAASIPLMIPYSGTIALKDGTLINGTGQFKFAIVNSGCVDDKEATPCTAFWSNDGSKPDGSEPEKYVSIPVSNGNFSVKLGDTSLTDMSFPLLGTYFTSGDTYLRIWFRDDISKKFELLPPDRQLVSVPYAYRAEVADTVTGTIGANQINSAEVQKRVTGNCAGKVVTAINQDGTVTCETDDTGASYTAGTGISISGNAISINNTQAQSRVTGTCAGQVVTAINQDGAVTCETDDGTTYTQGTGISISGNTISINNTQAQSRVSETCAAGSSIRTVNADGTVVCETDDVGSGAATDVVCIGCVDTTDIADGGIGTTKIAAGAVGTTQIADAAVTSAQIAAGAIGSIQISDESVSSIDILDGSIQAVDIGNLPPGDADYLQNQSIASQTASSWISGNMRAAGMLRLGSETGTTEGPIFPASSSGIIIRRTNTKTTTAGTVVATTGVLRLERDGTDGGFRAVGTTGESCTGGCYRVQCMGINNVGTFIGKNVNVNTDGSIVPIYSDLDNMIYIRCALGNPWGAVLGGATHQTIVELQRWDTDSTIGTHWLGFVTSTFNQ